MTNLNDTSVAIGQPRIGKMHSVLAGPSFGEMNSRRQAIPTEGMAALNLMQRAMTGADDDLGLMDLNHSKLSGQDGLNHAGMTGMMGLNAMAKPFMANAPKTADQQAREKQVNDYAQQLVAQVFYGTMLKQMRSSPFKSDLFSGGRGGQAYSSLYDQAISERMSRAGGNKLTRVIAKSILKKDAQARQAAIPMAQPPAAMVPEAAAEVRNSFANVRVHVAPDLGR